MPTHLKNNKFSTWFRRGALIALVNLLTQPTFGQDTVTIGAFVPLTGNWAYVGSNIEKGITLAVEEVNQAGGVLGKKLEVVIDDSDEEKSGSKVVTSYHTLKAQGVNVFIGPCGAPGFLSLEPLAIKDGAMLITPCTPGSFHKDSARFFNTGGDNYITTVATAELMYSEGFRKVAIFGSEQPWENQQAKTFREAFVRLGGSITAEVVPQADQTMLLPEASKIIKSKPEAVFFAIFNQISNAAKTMKELGYKGALFMAQADMDHVSPSAGGLEGGKFYLFASPSKAFTDKFRQHFGKEPSLFANSAYDAVISVAGAMRKANSKNPQDVAAAMPLLDITGSSGTTIKFNNDGLLERAITLFQVQNGNIVALEK